MLINLSNSAHLSQFDTPAIEQRLVLLGASNLSLSFPSIVETSRAMFARPLEIHVAMGFGRSYGQESKFFGKNFSGILHANLWEALQRAPPLPTSAVVADVGNDLAYGASPSTIFQWVSIALNRLRAHGATAALNNVPLASLGAVGAIRYRVVRSALFPRCRIDRCEMLSRAGRLSDALNRLAWERKIPVFSGELSWYGVDPIHPRRAFAGQIWEQMLTALGPPGVRAIWRRPARNAARAMRAVQRRAWLARDPGAPGPKATLRLLDGTSIALY